MSNIGSVKQDGNTVIVYDENGNFKFQKDGYELIGYTSTTITVKDCIGNYQTYDSNNQFLFQK